ncbi:RTA1 like protein-domain-containing protein [Halenospora varia]|nr:RTA1 like protein-domain-containing protein [Halenospora varia]
MKCKSIGPGCPADGSSLGYAPSMAASVIFMGAFGLALIGHIILGWKYRTWTFAITMILGSSSEVVGYLGRIFMHNNPYKLSTFLVQIVCLTTAPAFYSAGLYLCLSRIIIVYGQGISRIRPIWYTRFFIFCDSVSLSLQGAGGGVASAATKDSTMQLGNHLMLAGLIFQIVSLVLFAIACFDFAFRVRTHKSWKVPNYRQLRRSTRFKGFLWAATISFWAIFVRCVYRVVELGSGWNNKLMREETPFIILESSFITIAVLVLIIFHPGFAFHNKFNTLQENAEHFQGSSKEAFSLIATEDIQDPRQGVELR